MKHFLKVAGSFLFLFTVTTTKGQTDLIGLVGEDSITSAQYATASFKTTRVINSQSIENTPAGVLDTKISHRFGFINGGPYELFGLDEATIRIGVDYGITDRLMVGFGRSSFEKTYDVFGKYKILRQSAGTMRMPVTLSWFASVAATTLKSQTGGEEIPFKSRLYYAHQVLIGRKVSDGFTLQLMPTFIHRNLTKGATENNDVFAIGGAARQKISKRVAINVEYFYVLPDQIAEQYKNSLSIGFDIETGGHVFQLHFTNSTSMIERGFVTETVGDWFDGDIHFGFNVSRVFTIRKKQHE